MFTLRDPKHSHPITCLAWSPRGDALAMGNKAGLLTIWDLARRQPRLQLRLPGAREGLLADLVACLDYDPLGNRLAVTTGTYPPYVRVYQESTGDLLHQYEGAWSANAVVFLPDGDRVVSAGGEGYGAFNDEYPLYWWNLSVSRKREQARKGHTAEVAALARSANGALLASGGQDQTIRIWDAKDGTQYRVLTPRGWVRDLAFSPDGATLASAGGRTVSLWGVETGDRLRQMRGHQKTVRAVIFHPSGRFLASGSDDGTVLFWDPATGKESEGFRGGFDWQIGGIRGIRFAPDGLTAAAGGVNGSVVVWDVEAG